MDFFQGGASTEVMEGDSIVVHSVRDLCVLFFFFFMLEMIRCRLRETCLAPNASHRKQSLCGGGA